MFPTDRTRIGQLSRPRRRRCPPPRTAARGALVSGAVRVALLHPTYWPEVRRGAERLAHDLALQLTRRGHEVTLLTTHDAPTTTVPEEGFRVVRERRPASRWLDRLPIERELGRAPRLIGHLLGGGYDLAHALAHTDAWAAGIARTLGGPPMVLSLMGMPTSQSISARRLRRTLLRSAVRRAARVTVLSQAAAEQLRGNLGCEPLALPPGLDTADFSVPASRAEEPTVICAASLDDPRKRGHLLLRAFARLRASRPTARLVLAGRVAPTLRPLPAGVEFVNADATLDLARFYSSAWASVLPSVNEAFGLVLAESLAAGTPAAAAASGAAPDVIDDDAVGRLFRPDDEADLVRALGEVLDLGRRPSTGAACRARASEWDWDVVLPRYEALYEEVIRGSRRSAHGYSRSP